MELNKDATRKGISHTKADFLSETARNMQVSILRKQWLLLTMLEATGPESNNKMLSPEMQH